MATKYTVQLSEHVFWLPSLDQRWIYCYAIAFCPGKLTSSLSYTLTYKSYVCIYIYMTFVYDDWHTTGTLIFRSDNSVINVWLLENNYIMVLASLSDCSQSAYTNLFLIKIKFTILGWHHVNNCISIYTTICLKSQVNKNVCIAITHVWCWVWAHISRLVVVISVLILV